MPPVDRVTTIAELRAELDRARSEGRTVGLVPTMGYLHDGHLSLARAAAADCDVVVMSIFVNPLQFAPTEDLATYPRDPEGDAAKAASAGVTVLFTPSSAEMYPEGRDAVLTGVAVPGLSSVMEGASRRTHFGGVCTVVAKLFNIVGACRAYFGEKDYQQLAIVRRMAHDLSFPVEVVGCPIVREPDGLAMSSRNVYLTAEERGVAPVLQRALRLGAAADPHRDDRRGRGPHAHARRDPGGTARRAGLRRGGRPRHARAARGRRRQGPTVRRGAVRSCPPDRQRGCGRGGRHGPAAPARAMSPGDELDLLVLGSGVAGLSAAVQASGSHGLRAG